MMAQTCERLIRAGVPLWRVRRLRPYPASGYFRSKFRLEARSRSRGRYSRFRHSGFSGISQTSHRWQSFSDKGPRGQEPPDDPEARRFPIVDEMRAEGVTPTMIAAGRCPFTDGNPQRLELDHEAARRLHR